MSLVVYHQTIADNFDVDPNYFTDSGSVGILAGTLVGLNTSPFTPTTGYAVPASGALNAASAPVGLAGDSIESTYKTTAYSAQVVISGSGATAWTQNNVANYFNETLASGKITVYTVGGVFATDQYVGNTLYVPGMALYAASGTNTGLFTTVDPGGGRRVGYVKAAPAQIPSGVPGSGSNSVNGSLALGTYLTVILNF
jgi:hypothetical protein